ncbi:MAG: hypothetical protein WBD22_10415 [Pyrinomonadaceae bacterium]
MRERIRFEREISDLEFESSDSHSIPKTPGKKTPAAVKQKQIILVAGFDYEDPNHLMNSYCHNRIERILRQKRGNRTDPSLTFTLFDVGAGKVRTFNVSGNKRVWADTTTFTPVTAANYTGKTFDKSPSGVMSITDVYEFLRKQGKSNPGSVQELSFFAHGSHVGPILVNSYDTTPSHPFRDSNDKDGRAHKDFAPPNMDSAATKELEAAFAPTGFIWLWGCVFAAAPFQVLHRLFKNRAYKSGKIKDTDIVKFEFERTHADQFFAAVPTFFPAAIGGTFPLVFNRTFKQVKEFFQQLIFNGYCGQIALNANRKCFGALPGTYSEYDPKKSFLPLMLVPRAKPPGSADFTRQVNFYRKHMGMKLDPEGRGYGMYVP